MAKAKSEMLASQEAVNSVRKEAKDALLAADPKAKMKDSDYIFITFIMSELPHGIIGLLIAVMFASTLGSKASELNALGTTTTIDLWRQFRPLAANDETSKRARRQMVYRVLGSCLPLGLLSLRASPRI